MAYDVALIGFGEAAEAFAFAGQWGPRVSGYDLLPDRRETLVRCGLSTSDQPADVVRSAPLVISLVTADQALQASQIYAPLLCKGALWCDGNSVAPETKRAAARAIEKAGGRYVDMAILAPVKPLLLAVPLLLSGAAADDAARDLRNLGFSNVRVVGDKIGRASAIKMIRSVMVKGIEALTAEMMAAADAAGVAEEVLASLDASDRTQPWTERAAYNLERMRRHGARRAAEMGQVALTLRTLEVNPIMTEGTQRRQQMAADSGIAAP